METSPIVVLGGSEHERSQLVSQLSGSGLKATSETHLALAEGTPALIVITGPEAAHLVAEARDVPALAEVPILAIVPGVPATAATEALAAGATDVTRLPLSPAVLASWGPCFGEKTKESTCEQCRIQLYTAAAESIPRARIAPRDSRSARGHADQGSARPRRG